MTNESGIAVSVMSVVRKLSRNRNRMITTMIAPSRIACSTLAMAALMKLPCLKSGVIFTSGGKPFCRSARAFSTWAVKLIVSAPGCFCTERMTAGAPFTPASPRITCLPNFTSATSFKRIGTPLRVSTTALAISSMFVVRPMLRMSASWFAPSRNPPAVLTCDFSAASITCLRVTP